MLFSPPCTMKKELHIASTHLIDPRPCHLIPVKYGHEKVSMHILYTPQWNYYVVHYVFEGKGTLFIGEKTYSVGAGECFLIRPGDKASYIADKGDPWHYAWIGFRGETAEALTTLPSPVFQIPEEIFRPLLSMGYANEAEDYLLASILYRMLASIFAHPLRVSEHAEAAELYIRSHFREPITVASLAAHLGITPRYLSSLFKQTYGKTTQRRLIEIRLSHARDLLMRGWSVSKAAYEVGYSDPFVFSRAFCRHFGVPPKSYIKESKK